MDYRHKINSIAELLKLAKIDNNLDKKELAFIKRIADLTGVSKEDLEMVMRTEIEYEPPKDEFDRITQFQQLVLLMMIDGEVKGEELEFCKEFGLRTGLNLLAVDEIITRVIANEGKPLEPEVVMEIFKLHYN